MVEPDESLTALMHAYTVLHSILTSSLLSGRPGPGQQRLQEAYCKPWPTAARHSNRRKAVTCLTRCRHAHAVLHDICLNNVMAQFDGHALSCTAP